MEENRIVNAPRNVNRKELTAADERFILRKIKENPKLPDTDIAKELYDRNTVQVSVETVRNVLRKNNYNARVPRKKSFINQKNRKLRLDFAKHHESKPDEYWKDVIFVDESKCNIFGSDRRRFVWRKPNEELSIENTTATVKHDGV